LNSRPTILIIDDEAQIRRFLRVSLEASDYRVVEAATGQDGIVQAALSHPNVVILDLGLPDMSGNEVLLKIREWSSVPVLVLSVQDGEQEKIAAYPPRPREVVRRELGLAPEHVVIGKVARLFHLKGHEFVIAAARDVAARHPQARFLFIGDGILRQQYQEQIARAGIADRFVFTGLVPPRQIPELIHACDVVVHTSLWEGLARVLPQALIAGKPVVSYDVDGAREVVIPGETGFLLPPQSVDELAQALGTLIADASLRERLGRTGRERFTDQFRHETMTRQIRDVYARVLERAGNSPG